MSMAPDRLPELLPPTGSMRVHSAHMPALITPVDLVVCNQLTPGGQQVVDLTCVAIELGSPRVTVRLDSLQLSSLLWDLANAADFMQPPARSPKRS